MRMHGRIDRHDSRKDLRSLKKQMKNPWEDCLRSPKKKGWKRRSPRSSKVFRFRTAMAKGSRNSQAALDWALTAIRIFFGLWRCLGEWREQKISLIVHRRRA